MKSHDLVVWSFFFLLGNTDTTLDIAVQVSCSCYKIEHPLHVVKGFILPYNTLCYKIEHPLHVVKGFIWPYNSL
jgi:hypothetical protein